MNGEPDAKRDRDDGNKAITQAAWQISGALISGLVGFVFFFYKRGRDAKDHFLVTLSQLDGELQRSADHAAFHASSLPRLEEAVFRLRPFLRKPRATELSVTWNLYRKAASALQEAGDGSLLEKHFYDYFEKFGQHRPKTKREIIEWFHRRFASIAT